MFLFLVVGSLVLSTLSFSTLFIDMIWDDRFD